MWTLAFRRTSGVADVIVVEHGDESNSGEDNGFHENVNKIKYKCSDFVAHGDEKHYSVVCTPQT